MKKPDIYLYDGVPSGTNICVIRTSPSCNKGPGWNSTTSPEFTDIMWEVVKTSLGDNFNTYFYHPSRMNDDYKPKHGWCRMGAEHRQRFILGCLANDIDIQIIEWEDKK